MQKSLPRSIDPHRLRATGAGNALSPLASTSLIPSPGAFFHASVIRLDLGHAVGQIGVGGNDKACRDEVVPRRAPLSLSRTLTGMRARKPGDTTPC